MGVWINILLLFVMNSIIYFFSIKSWFWKKKKIWIHDKKKKNSNKILIQTPITSFIAYTDTAPMSCCTTTAPNDSRPPYEVGIDLLYLWIHRNKVVTSLQSTYKVSTLTDLEPVCCNHNHPPTPSYVGQTLFSCVSSPRLQVWPLA